MPLNPSNLASPHLMEILLKCKEHDLFVELHTMLSMNLISKKLVALGALDIVANPKGLEAIDIHRAMEEALEAYVRECLEKRRKN
jgi:hypothetical protein